MSLLLAIFFELPITQTFLFPSKVELSGVSCKNKCDAFMSHKEKRGMGARDNSREGGRTVRYSRQERKKEER